MEQPKRAVRGVHNMTTHLTLNTTAALKSFLDTNSINASSELKNKLIYFQLKDQFAYVKWCAWPFFKAINIITQQNLDN